jgi:hypothetical protein
MALATSEICGLEAMRQGWKSWVLATFNLRATHLPYLRYHRAHVWRA